MPDAPNPNVVVRPQPQPLQARVERIEALQNELEKLKAEVCGSPSPDQCRFGRTIFCTMPVNHPNDPHQNGLNRWLKEPLVFVPR